MARTNSSYVGAGPAKIAQEPIANEAVPSTSSASRNAADNGLRRSIATPS